MLLAQGEFDGFLLAAENERAELLEKITGTEIYAAISVRVHDGTEAWRRTVELLEGRRSDLGLLQDDARQTLLEEQSRLAGTIAQKVAQRDRHGERLDHVKRVVAARSDLAQAEARAAAARSAREAAADEYRSLTELDLVEPIRPLSADRENARLMAADVASRLAELVVVLEQARTLDEAAAVQLSDAITADETAEDIFKRFGPLWSDAERLDAELATAQMELSDAAEKSQGAETALRNHVDVLAELDKSFGQTSESLRTASAQLEDQSGRVILADRLDDATELLEKRGVFIKDRATAASNADEATECAARFESEIAELSEKLATDRDRKESLSRDVGELRVGLAAIDEPALHERDTHLQRTIEALREASTTCEQHIRASADLARGQSELSIAADQVSTARAQIASAESDQLRDRTTRAEVVPLAELADEAVSFEAAHLRSLLAPNSACPVCGSTEHPHLAHPSALNEMVATVRRRREELDAALATTSQRLAIATRALAAAEVRWSEASRVIDMACCQMSTAEGAYVEQRPMLDAVCSNARLAGNVPRVPDCQGVSEFAALVATAKAERIAIASPLADARRLQTEIDGVQRKHHTLGVAIESTIHNIDQRRSELHTAKLQINEHTIGKAGLNERLGSIDREIEPFLTAAGRTVDELDTNPNDVVAGLRTIAKEYDALRKRVGELDTTLRRLAPDRAAAAASLEHAQAHMIETAARLTQRRGVVDQKANVRANLLDGEATVTHRTRINETRRKARDSLAKARESKSAAAAAFQAAGARCEEASATLENTKGRSASVEEAFQAACRDIARSPDQVAAVIATDAAVGRALRARIQEIERAVIDTDCAVLMRQNDLGRALDGFDDAIDAEALAAVVAELAREIGDLHQQTGALVAALVRDDEARRTAATLSAEIDTARAELVVWQAVDDAIGSASGDRFRGFVQGITLDHLVQLANAQLYALSPRYRLAQGPASDLTLHIIDRDMGDEVRATRSLSGGERFLVSLALALALSGLEGRASFVDTLFIDEGFGSLDVETLGMAVDALETLQGRGRKVGVITHVAAMIERIAVQVRVEKRGAGRSEIKIFDGMQTIWLGGTVDEKA